ncbi:MAG: hypothetical protein MHMPM18_003012 [Marteilia pararefringens]
MVSALVYNHFKRTYLNILNETRGLSRPLIKKSNAIFIGPTGSGKTNIATCIRDMLDIPTIVVDSTSYTQAGYVGQDIESIIELLYSESNCDVFKTQNGIVFMDEIDKIATRSSTSSKSRDVGGEGVQQALLKMVEGTTVQIADKPKRKTQPDSRPGHRGSGVKSNFNPFGAFNGKFGSQNGSHNSGITGKDFNIPGLHFTSHNSQNPFSHNSGQSEVSIDTSNILFIGLGAFPGLTDIISERKDINSVGFDSPIIGDKSWAKSPSPPTHSETKSQKDDHLDAGYSLLKSVNVEDMRHFGFMSEFIGRFPILVPFHELNDEHYRQILLNSKCGILREYQKMLQLDNITLKFSETFLNSVALESRQLGIGARGLRTILESKLMDLLFVADSNKRYDVTLEKEGYSIAEAGSKSSKFRLFSDSHPE